MRSTFWASLAIFIFAPILAIAQVETEGDLKPPDLPGIMIFPNRQSGITGPTPDLPMGWNCGQESEDAVSEFLQKRHLLINGHSIEVVQVFGFMSTMTVTKVEGDFYRACEGYIQVLDLKTDDKFYEKIAAFLLPGPPGINLSVSPMIGN